MPLDALTLVDEIADAYERLAARLAGEAIQTIIRPVGWQGGGHPYPVYWHPDRHMWSLADASEANCYWFGFGDQDPTPESAALVPVFQIGLARAGLDRQRAGVFAADETGRVFVAHNGGIAGGRRGIGKNAFLNWYPGALQHVHGPDGRREECVVLGALDDPALLTGIARYMRQILTFKNRVTAVGAPSAVKGNRTPSRLANSRALDP